MLYFINIKLPPDFHIRAIHDYILHVRIFFINYSFFLNWRKMILQNVALFSQRATWIRHKHTYVMFLLNLLSPSWFHPSAVAKSLQSCPTLCNPIDGSPPGSAVPGILQARTLEWVAMPFPSAWKWKVKVKLLSRVWLLATPRTAAYQAPPSMGFSRQEY